jgi:hypothetical protein
MASFTNYSELDLVLEELISRAQNILGVQFLGAYINGSLVTGDFNEL